MTGFSMKDCLSLPGVGKKNFNSLRTEEDEPIYTYNVKYMRWFVRKSFKGGQICASNQNYKSKTCCDEKIKITSEELNVKGKNYGNVEAYLSYKKIYFKIFGKEYENQLNDYRDRDLDEKRVYQ